MSFQQVIVLGNMGNDPEFVKLNSGAEVCNFSLAVSERYKSGGETVEHTEWFRCVLWNEQQMDVMEKYVKKGNQLQVIGKLRTRKYTDRDGFERQATDVTVFQIVLVDRPPAADGGRGSGGGDRGGGDRGGGDRGGGDRGGRGETRASGDRGARSSGDRGARSSGDRGGDRGGNDQGAARARGGDVVPLRGGDRGGNTPQYAVDLDDEIPF